MGALLARLGGFSHSVRIDDAHTRMKSLGSSILPVQRVQTPIPCLAYDAAYCIDLSRTRLAFYTTSGAAWQLLE
jgi:hypothetical protein